MDRSHIDTAMTELQANKRAWAVLPVADKIAYGVSVRDNTVRVARAWVEAAVKAKGLTMDDPVAGEEWTSGPYSLLSLMNDLDATLRRLDRGESPVAGYKTRTTASGQLVVDVFPTTTDERLLYSGVSAEVWMQPGIEDDNLSESVAGFYRETDPQGDVCVVLAAGNIASIAPMDVVHALFNEGKVAILKMNPVNDYLGPYLEEVFADLIADGYVRMAYGGTDVGKYLTTHDSADSIHVTGSARTHDAIVFGDGEEGTANRAADRPVNSRPISSELGGVGPVIVVPGNWSGRDIRFQAEQIVSQKMHNSGFNCVAAQVLVVPENWEHTEPLIEAIRAVLNEMQDRDPYYPGAADRCAVTTGRSSGVETFGKVNPRYLVMDIDAESPDESLFHTEVFGPVLAVTSLPSPDVASYLKKAVRFVNHSLQGTLGANIIIHPRTEKRNRKAMERTLSDLDYGTIAVNTWTGVAYFMPKCTWGAYPHHPRSDIQSGRGVVHNVLMFDRAQKSVVRGPFAPGERAWMKGDFNVSPKPVYLVTNRQAHTVGERLIAYADSGSKADLAKVASAAVRG